jgi:hypothetical protein
MSVLVPWKAEEGARSPGAVVIGGHESPYLVWMLGTEPESSKKEGSALSHRVISPGTKVYTLLGTSFLCLVSHFISEVKP